MQQQILRIEFDKYYKFPFLVSNNTNCRCSGTIDIVLFSNMLEWWSFSHCFLLNSNSAKQLNLQVFQKSEKNVIASKEVVLL